MKPKNTQKMNARVRERKKIIVTKFRVGMAQQMKVLPMPMGLLFDFRLVFFYQIYELQYSSLLLPSEKEVHGLKEKTKKSCLYLYQ